MKGGFWGIPTTRMNGDNGAAATRTKRGSWDKIVEAKLVMLKAYETVLSKGKWVTWPDHNQYLVITPLDFDLLKKPYDDLLDAEDEHDFTQKGT